MGLLIAVDGDDVATRVAGLLELHVAHAAHVVLVDHREVRVGDHLGVVLRLLLALFLGFFGRRPSFFSLCARRLDAAISSCNVSRL